MGAGQSVPEGGKAPTRGLHVLRVTPASPASQTDIEPFFDFIIGYGNASLPSQNSQIEAQDFEKVVEDHEGKRLDLIIWSSKSQSVRHVSIRPSREWSQTEGGSAKSTSRPSLLGLSMRVCEPEFALDNVWHVLDVLESSPAESAGLVPYGDWIVGWSGGTLAAEGDFYDIVEAHEDKPLRVYVYSYDFDTLREVVLVPNRHWGGEGLLGCVFGYGLLHRIPVMQEDSTANDEEYYGGNEGNEVFVPADEIFEHPGHEADGYPVEPNNHRHVHISTHDAEQNPLRSQISNGPSSHYLDPPI